MSSKDWTDRQRFLDKEILLSGIKLENTKECLQKVMETIGAHIEESSFVLSRIQFRLKTNQLFYETDLLLNRIEEMLDRFKKDNIESEEILNKLGFKFPEN